jgi:hypothetical protein
MGSKAKRFSVPSELPVYSAHYSILKGSVGASHFKSDLSNILISPYYRFFYYLSIIINFKICVS